MSDCFVSLAWREWRGVREQCPGLHAGAEGTSPLSMHHYATPIRMFRMKSLEGLSMHACTASDRPALGRNGSAIGLSVGCASTAVFQQQRALKGGKHVIGCGFGTHGGEEIGFGAMGSFGLFARIGECGLRRCVRCMSRTTLMDFD